MLTYADATQDLWGDGLGATDTDYEQLAAIYLTFAKRVQALFKRALDEAGYNKGQDQLLMCLSAHKATPVALLSQELSVRAPAISKLLDSLSRKGLVERYADSSDKRVVQVVLTEAGTQAQKEIRQIWALVCRQISPEFDEGTATLQKQLTGLCVVMGASLQQVR